MAHFPAHVQGPNGPLLPEIADMYPNVTIVRRSGEINAWDNADFRAAVEATGKNQFIVGGIATDVSRLAHETPECAILNVQMVVGLYLVRLPIPP